MNSSQRSALNRAVPRALFLAGLLAAALVLAFACGGDKKPAPAAPAAPTAVTPAAPSPAAAAPAAPAGPLWAKPPISSSWQEYFGIQLEATLDASGPRVLNPKPGQVYFYTNSGTSWGATNTKNTVEIFDVSDMKSWKHLATVNLPDEYSLGYSSHGATVSADGRWIYLQAMANPEKPPRLIIIDGFTLKPYKVYKSTFPGFGGHHLNNFTGPDGREYIMNVDFGWNFGGAGGWVIDPEKDHAIVGGIHRFDMSGHPYVFSGDVQGKWMYASVPAPQSKYRGQMEGYLAKIDMTTWRVVDGVPVLDPVWAEVTQDGKVAWVTEGDGQKVKKIDLEKMAVIAEVSSGPGPWGARLSCDESKLYVADKGESAGYGQQGRTMTIIDTRFNIVTNVVPIGRTTDHIILSPDCKYVLASSNADHSFWVYDAETEELVTVVKVPSDGDVHGGTFVRWRETSALTGEVVSTLTGLRGSARQAQVELIKAAKEATIVRLVGYSASAGTPAAPAPDTVKVRPGAPVSVEFSYAAGTGAATLTLEGKALGIERFVIKPGGRKLVRFTAPRELGKYEVGLSGVPKTKALVISVEEAAAAAATPTPAAPAAVGPREIKLLAQDLKWSVGAIAVKPGERVKFTITNNDTEKHNLASASAGLLSPDADSNRTISYEWTAPSTRGTHKFICEYHPAMIGELKVE